MPLVSRAAASPASTSTSRACSAASSSASSSSASSSVSDDCAGSATVAELVVATSAISPVRAEHSALWRAPCGRLVAHSRQQVEKRRPDLAFLTPSGARRRGHKVQRRHGRLLEVSFSSGGVTIICAEQNLYGYRLHCWGRIYWYLRNVH